MKTAPRNSNRSDSSITNPHVRFEYVNPTATRVCLAGSFNAWHPDVTEMIDVGGGHWLKEVVLPPGRYEYRLVVDGCWLTDPNAAESVPNPYGERNAVLTVLPTEPLVATGNPQPQAYYENQTNQQIGRGGRGTQRRRKPVAGL